MQNNQHLFVLLLPVTYILTALSTSNYIYFW